MRTFADGDPRQEFHLGREDGSLLLAKRLVWERQPSYALNVSVSDGLHTVHTPVSSTCIRHAHWCSFERDIHVRSCAS